MSELGKNVAILAIYPKTSEGYILSLENLVDDLYKLDYTVIVVSNAKIDEKVISLFTNRNKTIICTRPNFGRDFGAYQSAILWLFKQSNLGNIESLLILNDTLLWKKGNAEIFKWLTAQSWGCIFLNLERHTHAQSFALHFDRQLISSLAFKNFWLQYLPLSSRRHAIHAGEIELSSRLLRAGFEPKPFVNPDLFLRKYSPVARERLKTNTFSFVAGLPVSGIFPSPQAGAPHAFDPNNSFLNSRARRAVLSQDALFHWLSHYAYSDAPHRIGLHLSVLFGIPMKRDMYKFHRFSEIRESLEKFSPNSAKPFFEDIVMGANRFMVGDKKGRIDRLNGEV